MMSTLCSDVGRAIAALGVWPLHDLSLSDHGMFDYSPDVSKLLAK